jgi:hydrogenase maturation protease
LRPKVSRPATKKPISPAELERRLGGVINGRKTAILCVGNPVRSDDGAAQLLFRKLGGRVVRISLLDCGTTPQDCLEEVVQVEPSVVIFVNAIDHSLRPGAITLEELQTNSSSGSSLLAHKFPLIWTVDLLKIMGHERNLGIETFLVGIQIGSTTGSMTKAVRISVEKLSKLFRHLDSSAAGSMPDTLGQNTDRNALKQTSGLSRYHDKRSSFWRGIVSREFEQNETSARQ